MLIEDAAQQVYQVPETVLPRPSGAFETSGGDHELEFDWANEPFSFSVKRSGTNEILFDSSAVCTPRLQSDYLSSREQFGENLLTKLCRLVWSSNLSTFDYGLIYPMSQVCTVSESIQTHSC